MATRTFMTVVSDGPLRVAPLYHLPVVAFQDDESASKKDFLEHSEVQRKRLMDLRQFSA